jgi:hypothetical protein
VNLTQGNGGFNGGGADFLARMTQKEKDKIRGMTGREINGKDNSKNSF